MRTEIVNNLSFKEYREAEGLSKHAFDAFAVAPAMFAYRKANPITASRNMVLGTLIHAYTLEGDKQFAVGPKVDRRTKAGKEEWESFCIENAGKEIVTEEEGAIIQGVADAARPLIDKYCGSDLLIEQSLFWERGGLQCKGRPDIIGTFSGRPAIIDLKTTADISQFDRKFYSLRYDIQAEWYTYGCSEVLGTDPEFWFLAVDTQAPHLAQFVLAGEQTIKQAQIRTDLLLKKMRACVESGDFSEGLPEIRTTI